MTPIARALALGYAAPQILEFVQNAFPSLTSKIKKAQSTGHSVESILKLINRGMGGGDELDNLTESQIHTRTDEQQNQLSQDLLKGAAGTAAGFAASKGLQGILGGGQTVPNPGGPTPTTPSPQPSIGPQPMANAPVRPPVIPPVGPTPAGGPVPNVPSGQMPPVPQPGQNVNPAKSIQLLKNLGVDKTIDNLISAGNAPQNVSDIVEKFVLKPEQRKHIQEAVKAGEIPSFKDAVKDYLTNQPATQSPQDAPNSIQEAPDVQEAHTTHEVEQTQEEEPKRPEKGQTVIDVKSGIAGQLKDIKQKQALIDEDGKLHKVAAQNVESIPLSEKDLAELLDDLHKGIERTTGEEVSRPIRLVAYNEDKNLLIFVPFGGKPYLYDDISEEDKQYLKSLQLRRTTGNNFIGGWEKGTKSIMGSKMHDFIKKLQAERGGKGNEYLAKFDYLYDPHGVAIEAKKEKHRKQQAEERARKKGKK